jgi:hypothetical protein
MQRPGARSRQFVSLDDVGVDKRSCEAWRDAGFVKRGLAGTIRPGKTSATLIAAIAKDLDGHVTDGISRAIATYGA